LAAAATVLTHKTVTRGRDGDHAGDVAAIGDTDTVEKPERIAAGGTIVAGDITGCATAATIEALIAEAIATGWTA